MERINKKCRVRSRSQANRLCSVWPFLSLVAAQKQLASSMRKELDNLVSNLTHKDIEGEEEILEIFKRTYSNFDLLCLPASKIHEAVAGPYWGKYGKVAGRWRKEILCVVSQWKLIEDILSLCVPSLQNETMPNICRFKRIARYLSREKDLLEVNSLAVHKRMIETMNFEDDDIPYELCKECSRPILYDIRESHGKSCIELKKYRAIIKGTNTALIKTDSVILNQQKLLCRAVIDTPKHIKESADKKSVKTFSKYITKRKPLITKFFHDNDEDEHLNKFLNKQSIVSADSSHCSIKNSELTVKLAILEKLKEISRKAYSIKPVANAENILRELKESCGKIKMEEGERIIAVLTMNLMTTLEAKAEAIAQTVRLSKAVENDYSISKIKQGFHPEIINIESSNDEQGNSKADGKPPLVVNPSFSTSYKASITDESYEDVPEEKNKTINLIRKLSMTKKFSNRFKQMIKPGSQMILATSTSRHGETRRSSNHQAKTPLIEGVSCRDLKASLKRNS